MSDWNATFLNPAFSHLYVEERVLSLPRTRAILARFPKARVIPIRHHKDIFNRPRQDRKSQSLSPALILGRHENTFLLPGAPVCQSFGHEFMTASLCMNCPYDCDYCYLKGMYPSGHLCLFVNLEDLEAEIRARLLTAPLYLSVSYDTDLCALEPIHGYVHAMHRLCSLLPDLVCEVRTKCACTALLRELPPLPNFILAMTLSPHEVIRISEHRTPSLKARLEAVRTGLDRGHSIRLCLDPLLFTPDWQRQQQLLVKTMLRILGPERLRKVRDFSVGSFRISQAYLPGLRKCCRTSPLVQYPFRNVRGYYQYPPSLALAMEASMTALLRPFADEEKIFRWEADP